MSVAMPSLRRALPLLALLFALLAPAAAHASTLGVDVTTGTLKYRGQHVSLAGDAVAAAIASPGR